MTRKSDRRIAFRALYAVAYLMLQGASIHATHAAAAESAEVDSSIEVIAGVRSLPDPKGISVGSIEDLDLEALRAAIAGSEVKSKSADAEIRKLGLEESIRIALENNLEIQLRATDNEIAEATTRERRAKFHPRVGALGDFEGFNIHQGGTRPDEDLNRQRALGFLEQEVPTGGSVRLGVGYEREFTSKNSEQDVTVNFDNTRELAGLSIEVFQPLLKGGRVFVARSGIVDAEYGEQINQAILGARMLEVKALTKEAYYGVIRARRQVEVVERAMQRDRQLLDASDALYDAGRVSKVDVYSARIGQATNRTRHATSRAELEVQQNELRRVIGLPVGVKIRATENAIPFEPVAIDLAEWITRALRNRPELLMLKAEIDRAELHKRVAGNDKLPELGIQGGFQPGFDWKSYNWTAGLGFSMPIGNVAPRARYQQAEGVRTQAQTQLYRKRREIELEVRGLEIQIRENLSRISSLTHAVESSRSKREVAAGRFEHGLANNLDIVNADEELIRSESQLLTAVADYATTLAQLEAALAGSL